MSDYVLNDDGTATFDFDDFTRVLKRPTLRKYRENVEALGALRDEVLTKMTEDDDGPTQKKTMTVQIDLVVGWFDHVFESLSGEGLPRRATTEEEREAYRFLHPGHDAPEEIVDEDKIPSWLISADVVAELINHWQQNPSRRGAR